AEAYKHSGFELGARKGVRVRLPPGPLSLRRPRGGTADAPLFYRFRDSHGAKIGTWASLERPPASDAGERWFESSRPDCNKACHTGRKPPYVTVWRAKRNGKPIGDDAPGRDRRADVRGRQRLRRLRPLPDGATPAGSWWTIRSGVRIAFSGASKVPP